MFVCVCSPYEYGNGIRNQQQTAVARKDLHCYEIFHLILFIRFAFSLASPFPIYLSLSFSLAMLVHMYVTKYIASLFCMLIQLAWILLTVGYLGGNIWEFFDRFGGWFFIKISCDKFSGNLRISFINLYHLSFFFNVISSWRYVEVL